LHPAATFLSSYIHTVIIYLALCVFSFTVYAGGSDLGSPKIVTLYFLATPLVSFQLRHWRVFESPLDRRWHAPPPPPSFGPSHDSSANLTQRSCSAPFPPRLRHERYMLMIWKPDSFMICPQVYEHLVIKSAASPVAGNKGGSYLTMFS